MKKTLLLAALLVFTTTSAFAADTVKNPNKPCPISQVEKQKMYDCHKKYQREDRKAEFENRLKLTDAQKAKINANNEKNRAEIKPVIDKLKAKKCERREIIQQKEKTDPELIKLNEEIKALEKQKREIFEKNMKAFESVLTKEQKAELAKIKEEGRNNYRRHHAPKMPIPEFDKGKCPKTLQK